MRTDDVLMRIWFPGEVAAVFNPEDRTGELPWQLLVLVESWVDRKRRHRNRR